MYRYAPDRLGRVRHSKSISARYLLSKKFETQTSGRVCRYLVNFLQRFIYFSTICLDIQFTCFNNL